MGCRTPSSAISIISSLSSSGKRRKERRVNGIFRQLTQEEPERDAVVPAKELESIAPRVFRERVTEHFFRRLVLETRPISTITLVSPWISESESGSIGLGAIRSMIRL